VCPTFGNDELEVTVPALPWGDSGMQRSPLAFNNNNNNYYYNYYYYYNCRMKYVLCGTKRQQHQVIPIVTSSTGVNPKSLSQSLTRLNLNPNT
jgi:hypothetical protein